MKGVLSGKATSTIKGLYRLECPWISGKAIRIDLWYCLSGNGFLIDIASVSTSISALVTFDCTFCKNGKIACVYKTWNSHWITWQNDEELRKCKTPFESHGILRLKPQIHPLRTYGNSPLCPTGHRSPGFKEKDSANLEQSLKICIQGQFFVLKKTRWGTRLNF